MIRQGEQASLTLGEIYMKAMNYQMQLHFRSIIELKIKQVEGIVNKTPPETTRDHSEKHVRNFVPAPYCGNLRIWPCTRPTARPKSFSENLFPSWMKPPFSRR